MTQKTEQILTRAGVDVEAAKARLMGNEKLLLRLLLKIDCGKNWADLEGAFASADPDQAFQASHALKGLFGNLSVMPLYDLLSRQTALLRAGELPAGQALLPEIRQEMDALHQALCQVRQAEEN